MAVVGRLRSPRLTPAPGSPAPGEMYYDTNTNTLLWWSGTAWVPAGNGGVAGSSWVSALSAQPILDVGIRNQIRAGRVLTPGDFTAMGLSTPVGLWNLTNVNDSSGNGNALINYGTYVLFGVPGITGTTPEAALWQPNQRSGATMYRNDTGAADPFRITTGSVGCWVQTQVCAPPAQGLVGKAASSPMTAANQAYYTNLNASGVPSLYVSDGTTLYTIPAVTYACDGRWHFVVATFDGTIGRIYVDGVLEGLGPVGPCQATTAPVNIGSRGGSSTLGVADVHYGYIDEAFITADVLSEDNVRFLYAAKIPHTLGKTPTVAALNVRWQCKGKAFTSANVQSPTRLYNFTGSLADLGSGNVPLTGSPIYGEGLEGPNGAVLLNGSYSLSATDTGLASGTQGAVLGCWVKATKYQSACIMGWGVTGTADVRLTVDTNGCAHFGSGSNDMLGPLVCDGRWHLLVGVTSAGYYDAYGCKFWVDGKVVAVAANYASITKGGAAGFRVGANPDGTGVFTGLVDGVFTGQTGLYGSQDPSSIQGLYALGGMALPASPKDSGPHVEAMDASNVYAIFDTLETHHLLDLAVGA